MHRMQERYGESLSAPVDKSWTSLRLRTTVRDQLSEFCEPKGLSHGSGIKLLLDFYRKHQGGRDAL